MIPLYCKNVFMLKKYILDKYILDNDQEILYKYPGESPRCPGKMKIPKKSWKRPGIFLGEKIRIP